MYTVLKRTCWPTVLLSRSFVLSCLRCRRRRRRHSGLLKVLIVFQSTSKVNSYDVLMVLNKQYDLCFHCRNLVRKVYLLNWRKLKKNYRREIEIKLTVCTKLVVRGLKLWPWRQRLEEGFKIARFFHKLYAKLFHTFETFYLPSVFWDAQHTTVIANLFVCKSKFTLRNSVR